MGRCALNSVNVDQGATYIKLFKNIYFIRLLKLGKTDCFDRGAERKLILITFRVDISNLCPTQNGHVVEILPFILFSCNIKPD